MPCTTRRELAPRPCPPALHHQACCFVHLWEQPSTGFPAALWAVVRPYDGMHACPLCFVCHAVIMCICLLACVLQTPRGQVMLTAAPKFGLLDGKPTCWG
jgi:hypothetical protein